MRMEREEGRAGAVSESFDKNSGKRMMMAVSEGLEEMRDRREI